MYDIVGASGVVRLVQISVRIVPQYFRARLCSRSSSVCDHARGKGRLEILTLIPGVCGQVQCLWLHQSSRHHCVDEAAVITKHKRRG